MPTGGAVAAPSGGGGAAPADAPKGELKSQSSKNSVWKKGITMTNAPKDF